MNIEINIDRHPVAARGVVARQITYKEMWEKVSARVDVLTGELEAANQRIKAMQQRNEQLWDSYQDLRSTVNVEKTATTAKSKQTQDGSIFAVEMNVPPVESFCWHPGDCANPTDSRIAELLATIDQVAIDYGSLGFGLPMHVPAIKERMFEAVRLWIAKGGE